MLAAVYEQFGDSDVLSVREVPRPEPGPGEVLVRVHVSAVNPTDWKARRGSRDMRFPFQVPNQDGAGVVEAVGPGVDESRIGERVWIYFAARRRQFGTAGQWTAVPSEHAVAMGDATSMDLGASMGVPALTAHRALFVDGPVDGKVVLVSGGAGAVGHSTIELAKHFGAGLVITTVSSPEKAALAEAAGADVVIDYRAQDVVGAIRGAAPDGVDRIVEVALGENIGIDQAVLAPHGSVMSYATTSVEPTLDVRSLMYGNQTLRFMLLYDVPEPAIRQGVEDVTQALAAGALTELPATRFALEDVAAAHDAVEGGLAGKALIDIP